MSTTSEIAPLSRETLVARTGSGEAAPSRIVHLGLGRFFRAHQAWYTAHASDASAWGIAAFTGRSPRMSDTLSAQDGLYCLVVRAADSDTVEVIPSVSEVHAGSDVARLLQLVSDPATAVITLTVTEAGYRFLALPSGGPDLNDPVLAADVERLSGALASKSGATPDAEALGALETASARLLAALAARRAAGVGGLAVVPCDNIPANGAYVERGLIGLAERVDAALADWIREHVSFVSTSIDRITPDAEIDPAIIEAAGWVDASPVVTEPFADWVLEGEFPAGRPDWASAGARFVDDIEPWENRKLWLLNGAHSILSFAGLTRGFQTVAEATADPECRDMIESFWAEAVQCLPDDIEHAKYRAQLIERFENPNIVHKLEQISAEATTKVAYRIAVIAEQSLAAGRSAPAAIRAIGEWVRFALAGPSAPDARADEVSAAAQAADPVEALIALVSPTLAANTDVVAEVRQHSMNH